GGPFPQEKIVGGIGGSGRGGDLHKNGMIDRQGMLVHKAFDGGEPAAVVPAPGVVAGTEDGDEHRRPNDGQLPAGPGFAGDVGGTDGHHASSLTRDHRGNGTKGSLPCARPSAKSASPGRAGQSPGFSSGEIPTR